MAEIVGARLRDLIRERGTTQTAVAAIVGVAQPSIGRLISGETRETGKLLELAQALRTSVEYLTGETDDPAPGYAASDHYTDEERELLDLMERLDGTDRAAVLQIMRKLAGVGRRPTLHVRRDEYRSGE